MGTYTGTAVEWKCVDAPFETSVRLYDLGAEGEVAVFGQHWAIGASGTSRGPANPRHQDPLNAQESTISGHPSIMPTTSADLGPQSAFIYYNQMVGGMADGTKYVCALLSCVSLLSACPPVHPGTVSPSLPIAAWLVPA
jgi:hypothetical protein